MKLTTRPDNCLFGVLLCSLIILLSACTSQTIPLPTSQTQPDNYQHNKTYKLTILHTNDNHGRFWTDRKGRYGMSARMTLIEKIRKEVKAEGGYVLLLSGGDVNTGVPESDLQDAVPDFKGMNLMGYNAMAVGNHEFDNPRHILKMQQKLANFPFLSANIIDKKTGKSFFKPYALFDFDGLKVAVIGLTTTDTPKQTNPEHVTGLEFRSPVEVASQLIPELDKKANIIIALTHMGHYRNAKHGVNAPGDVTLARRVEDIDLIIGGHSQNPLFEPDQQGETYIMQAYEWGKYVGRADLAFRNGKLELEDYELIPINPKDATIKIPQHPEMLSLLTPYQEKGQKLVQNEIGSVDHRLEGERDEVRFRPTNLGTLIARALMAKTGADIGIMNGGGIRASIEPGTVTFKDVLTVLPFGNTLVTVKMRGDELKKYLAAIAAMPPGSGAFAHFSGVEMTINDGKIVSPIRVSGKPLKDDKAYTIALLNFSANGGDGYPNLKGKKGYLDTGFADADVLREYIEKHTPLHVKEFEPVGVIRK